MKDKATFDQEFENKEKFPRHYFDSVAKRSQALEKERKQGDAKKSDNEDFVLSQNYPKYQDKHCFFDDELEDEGDVGYRSDNDNGRLVVAEAEAEAEEPPLRGLDSVDAVVSQPIKARRGSSVEASKELGEVAPLLNDTEEEDEGEDEDEEVKENDKEENTKEQKGRG